MSKLQIEVPAQIAYWMKMSDSAKNRQERYEYLVKLDEIKKQIQSHLDKYVLEYSTLEKTK